MKKLISHSLIMFLALQSVTVYAAPNLPGRPAPKATSTEEKANAENMGQGGIIERRIANRFEKMNARYEATILRLEKIKTRIQSRIDKIKAAGGKTTDAEKSMTEAQVNIDAAKTALATLKTATDSVANLELHASTTEAKKALANVRNITKEIEKDLQKTHKALEKALGSLKGFSQLHNATSTADKKNDQ